MMWAVYTRRYLNTPWRLLFLLPPTLLEADIVDCIIVTDTIKDDGYKHHYYYRRMAIDAIMPMIEEVQLPYRG